MIQDPAGLLQVAIAVAIFLLVGFPIHEFSHALAAYRLGDSTARFMGRLTLDPRAHFDPLGGGLLALTALANTGFAIGWAKPTPVNPINLEGGRRGEALVALAGPLSNLVMAALVAIPLRIIGSGDLIYSVCANPVSGFLYGVMTVFLGINVVLFVFNLLPIPPLDGWRVLLGLVDARTAYTLRQYEQYGFIVLILLIFIGVGFIAPIIRTVVGFLAGPLFIC